MRVGATVLILCATMQTAHAGVCTGMRGFAAGDTPPAITGLDAACSTSRQLGGGTSRDCQWAFDYRSADATQAFEALARVLERCSDSAVVTEGAQVNHPDSYDQMTGKIGERAVSLSLKDKGALQQTMVFLRALEL